MPDERALREKAREVIEQHKLPNRKPDRMWGGKGLGIHVRCFAAWELVCTK